MQVNLKNIYLETLSVVAPRSLVQSALSHWDFSDSVDVLALGKAAVPMMLGAKELLDHRFRRGFVLTKYGHIFPEARASLFGDLVLREAGHPMPDLSGYQASKELLHWLVQSGGEELLVLCSGGSSSLLVSPSPPLSLEDLQTINGALLRSGLPIETLNVLRKHLSQVKGGQLAAHCEHNYQRMRQLLMVDICAPQLEDEEILSLVGSGPFVADSSTLGEAKEVLKKLRGVLSRDIFDQASLALRETPKQSRCRSEMLASHHTLREAAVRLVGPAQLQAPLWEPTVLGEVRQVADDMARCAVGLQEEKKYGVLVASGEPTVRIEGSHSGRGGRCQELALRFARQIAGRSGIALLAGSSDGTDGPTGEAGALVDGNTWPEICRQVGEKSALAMLESHDSGTALSLVTGSLLRTGPTGQNLNDLYLLKVSRLF